MGGGRWAVAACSSMACRHGSAGARRVQAAFGWRSGPLQGRWTWLVQLVAPPSRGHTSVLPPLGSGATLRARSWLPRRARLVGAERGPAPQRDIVCQWRLRCKGAVRCRRGRRRAGGRSGPRELCARVQHSMRGGSLHAACADVTWVLPHVAQVKLWDLGTRTCAQTSTEHTDQVRARMCALPLLASPPLPFLASS